MFIACYFLYLRSQYFILVIVEFELKIIVVFKALYVLNWSISSLLYSLGILKNVVLSDKSVDQYINNCLSLLFPSFERSILLLFFFFNLKIKVKKDSIRTL